MAKTGMRSSCAITSPATTRRWRGCTARSRRTCVETRRLCPTLPFRNLVAQARLGVSAEEHESHFRALLGDVRRADGAVRPDRRARGWNRVHGSPASTSRTDLARRLREQARRLGVSVASLWHVVCAQVLARLSGRDDVVFGTVLFGRMHSAEEVGSRARRVHQHAAGADPCRGSRRRGERARGADPARGSGAA